MDQLPVDSHCAMPCQLMPLELAETGAAELEEPLPELLEELELEPVELEPAELEPAELEPVEALRAGALTLVPTATIFGWAGVMVVRDTSVLSVWAPLVVVTW